MMNDKRDGGREKPEEGDAKLNSSPRWKTFPERVDEQARCPLFFSPPPVLLRRGDNGLFIYFYFYFYFSINLKIKIKTRDSAVSNPQPTHVWAGGWKIRGERLIFLYIKKISPENLARLTKHALAVVVTNLDTGETVEYKSMAAAAREFGVRTEAVRRCIKSQKPLHNKYQIILKS